MNKSIQKKIFIILIIITSIIFIKLLREHYATDTYVLAYKGYNNYAKNMFLSAGRIFSALITYISGILNLPVGVHAIIHTIISIIISCVSVMYVIKMFERYKKIDNKKSIILVTTIAYSIIFNYTYLELFYFAESSIMTISVLLAIISANKFADEKYKISLILLIITVFCYQSSITIYIIICLMQIFLKYDKIDKNAIKDIIRIILFVLIAFIVNKFFIALYLKLFNVRQTKKQTIMNMLLNLKDSFFRYTYLCLFKNPAIESIYIYIFIVMIIINLNISVKDKIKIIFLSIISLLMSIVMSIYVGYYAERIALSLGMIIGITYFYIYCKTDIFKQKSIFNYLLIAILIIYVILNAILYIKVFYNHELANKFNERDCEILEEYIEKYEEKIGIKVKKIAVINCNSDMEHYYNLKKNTIYTARPLKICWCAAEVLNFYEGRYLIDIMPNEEIDEELILKYKNTDTLTAEQIIFYDDTVYLYI